MHSGAIPFIITQIILLNIDSKISKEQLRRKLPEGVVNITTELYFVTRNTKRLMLTINNKTVHCIMNHACDTSAKKRCEYLGYIITKGPDVPCNSCREAKSKQAEVSKIRESNVSTLANRLVCFDISILKRSLKYTNQQRITKP